VAAKRVMNLFWSICILQCLVVLVLYFGDIGFDKPGKFGLAFEHLLILMLMQGCLFVAAVIIIFRRKQWKYFGAQFLLLVVTALGVVTN